MIRHMKVHTTYSNLCKEARQEAILWTNVSQQGRKSKFREDGCFLFLISFSEVQEKN